MWRANPMRVLHHDVFCVPCNVTQIFSFVTESFFQHQSTKRDKIWISFIVTKRHSKAIIFLLKFVEKWLCERARTVSHKIQCKTMKKSSETESESNIRMNRFDSIRSRRVEPISNWIFYFRIEPISNWVFLFPNRTEPNKDFFKVGRIESSRMLSSTNRIEPNLF
jgi:hypothetical protein